MHYSVVLVELHSFLVAASDSHPHSVHSWVAAATFAAAKDAAVSAVAVGQSFVFAAALALSYPYSALVVALEALVSVVVAVVNSVTHCHHLRLQRTEPAVALRYSLLAAVALGPPAAVAVARFVFAGYSGSESVAEFVADLAVVAVAAKA